MRVNLARERDAALVDLLGHDNDWFVRHARRLLQERAAAGRLAADTPRLLQEKLVAATTAPKKLRVIWALHVAGLLDVAGLERLLGDPEPVVRSWAIQLAAERQSVSAPLLEKFAVLAAEDPSPVVRLALASALQRVPPAARWPIATALVAHAEDAGDHNLPLMNWYAIEPLVTLDTPRAVDLALASRIPTVSRFIVRRAAFDESGYGPLVERLASADSATRTWMLEEIVAALAARGRMAAPPAWQRGWEILAADPDEGVRRLARLVAVRFRDPRAMPALRAVVADARAGVTARREALAALVAAQDGGLPPLLHGLFADAAIRNEALEALAAVPHDDTPAAIVAAYQALPADARQAAIATLVSRPAWTLQTPTERVTVSLDDIETRVLSPQSLMPENQLGQLSPEAARDLVAYLRHPTQVPLPGR